MQLLMAERREQAEERESREKKDMKKEEEDEEMEKVNSEIKEEEVRKGLKEFKNNKMAGEDGMVAGFLEYLPKTWLRQLREIIDIMRKRAN